MKKLLAVALVALMAISLFAGCNQATTPKGETLKTGLAVVSTIDKSKDATAEADGVGQVDSVAVAVTVNKDGKIVNAKIDTAQTKISFSVEGVVTADLSAVQKSKQELGDEYGMKGRSDLGKEWNEQADAFAKYVVGKTVSEVKGIALDETGHPTGSDLTSSVTISVTGYIEGIEKAVANAQELGAVSGDKLGLGLLTGIDGSKDATAEADGLAQAYTYYAAVTFGADGKITSAALDAYQGKVNFSQEGTVTSDLAGVQQTKQELGPDYNMKARSPIGKEWDEQTDAFAKYVTGKTASEVAGIALAEGKATSSDITSSVTVSIDGLMEVIAKANANAK